MDRINVLARCSDSPAARAGHMDSGPTTVLRRRATGQEANSANPSPPRRHTVSRGARSWLNERGIWGMQRGRQGSVTTVLIATWTVHSGLTSSQKRRRHTGCRHVNHLRWQGVAANTRWEVEMVSICGAHLGSPGYLGDRRVRGEQPLASPCKCAYVFIPHRTTPRVLKIRCAWWSSHAGSGDAPCGSPGAGCSSCHGSFPVRSTRGTVT